MTYNHVYAHLYELLHMKCLSICVTEFYYITVVLVVWSNVDTLATISVLRVHF